MEWLWPSNWTLWIFMLENKEAWKWNTLNVKWINTCDLSMLGRKMKSVWCLADDMHVLYFSCFSWQCSQRPQLPGLHPTVEQPQWVPVHTPGLEEGGLRPLYGPHLLPDGLLLRQPVSRRGNLCGWPLIQLVLRSGDYTKREEKTH